MYKKEIEILKALDVLGFTHIARDKDGNIFAYLPKPIKGLKAEIWLFDGTVSLDKRQTIKLKRELFTFVDWKDKEPTNILNLLSKISNILQEFKEFENEKALKLGKLYEELSQLIVAVPLFEGSKMICYKTKYRNDEKYTKILNKIKELENE